VGKVKRTKRKLLYTKVKYIMVKHFGSLSSLS